jgi:hypothetical protein
MATLYMAWRGVDDDQNLWWAVTFDGKRWSRQLPLSDRASADAPALAAFQDKLFMAWRGAGDDNLWWATYDGNADLKWSDQHQLTDRGSAVSPCMAVFRNQLFMAWRGVPGDQNLYWATYDENDPRKWTDQRPLSDRASFGVPTLAAIQDRLFMAWRGVEGDEDLYWATYDGNPDLKWLSQNPLMDRASAVGPALAVFQNKLYMVWRGIGGVDSDESLYWATYDENDPRKWTDQTVMKRVTADRTGIIVFGSVQRPSLAVFQNSIFVAGAGFNTAGSAGAPETSNADPEDLGGSAPPPLEPKGLFYFNFDGEIPSLPILVFPDRASEAPVTQAVFVDIPISLKNVMVRHGFDPSKGFKEFIREFNLFRSITLRALVGF